MRLLNVPTAFEQGGEYVLTADLRIDETVRAGFQVAARFADGAAKGRAAVRAGLSWRRRSLRNQTIVGAALMAGLRVWRGIRRLYRICLAFSGSHSLGEGPLH